MIQNQISDVTLNDLTFTPYLRSSTITGKVTAMTLDIRSEHSMHDDVVFIVVLNGAYLFAAELLSGIDIPNARVEFIKPKSYEGTESTGKVKMMLDLPSDLDGKRVILIEDIVDTGRTMVKIKTEIHKAFDVKSIQIATLLDKKDARIASVSADWTCFDIPNEFVVGYGLDYDGLGRTLPHIYKVKQQK